MYAKAKGGNYLSKTTHSNRKAAILKRLAAVLLAAAITVTCIIPAAAIPAEAASTTTWGVFIGVTLHGNVSKVKNYKSIVIDGQNYTKSEITKLKEGGRRKVYSYLSIGSIATYRSYYNRFKKYTLGNYDNWPSEKWIDTSKVAWQDFVVNTLAANLKKKGVDGLWVDNTDVWYEYHRAPIYNGLVYILRRCKAKGFKIIINGGDVFVQHTIRTGKQACIDGVMQEEVLTRIANYNNNGFAKQLSSDRLYYEAYLRLVKRAHKSIALLEYTRSAAMRKAIINYCKKRGYSYYISNNVALK